MRVRQRWKLDPYVTQRLEGMWLVAQDSTGGGNEQAGFDVTQPNPLTMKLSSHVDLVARHSAGCDGELNVNVSNHFHVIGKRLSPRFASLSGREL